MNNVPSAMPDFDAELVELGLAGIFYLIYMLIMMAVSVGSYVFQSLGFYSIAKRRGIKKPWLAWIPAGNLWILGSISDQYQYVVKGRVKNKRKSLLILTILLYVLTLAVMTWLIIFIVAVNDHPIENDIASGIFFGGVLGSVLVYLAIAGISIAVTVITYIALYDLYRSCDPANGLMYLLLSIFVNITHPIFLFICRNKDMGMPPRRQDTIPQQPVEMPPWRPVDNTAELWDHPEE